MLLGQDYSKQGRNYIMTGIIWSLGSGRPMITLASALANESLKKIN
jgi:hypothetical protein